MVRRWVVLAGLAGVLSAPAAADLKQELQGFFAGLAEAYARRDVSGVLLHYQDGSFLWQEVARFLNDTVLRLDALAVDFEVVQAERVGRDQARATVRARWQMAEAGTWRSQTEWQEFKLVRGVWKRSWRIDSRRVVLPAEHRVRVDFSGGEQMLTLLRALRAADPEAETLVDRMLASEVYRLAFFPHHNRTPGTLPPAAYKKMLLALPAGEFPALAEVSERGRGRLWDMWEKLRVAYEHPEELAEALAELKSQDFSGEAVERAAAWLPEGYRIDTHFYFLCDGRSGGYAINDVTTADLLQLKRGPDGRPRFDVDVMAHELHHNGYTRLPDLLGAAAGGAPQRQLLAQYVGVALAEGTPSRLINQMPRGFSGEAAREWQGYEEQEGEIFARYERTLRALLAGTADPAAARAELVSYWLAGWHGPAYYVGVRMVDAIYRVEGREGVLAVLLDRSQFLARYNQAAEKLAAGGEARYRFEGELVQAISKRGRKAEKQGGRDRR